MFFVDKFVISNYDCLIWENQLLGVYVYALTFVVGEFMRNFPVYSWKQTD